MPSLDFDLPVLLVQLALLAAAFLVALPLGWDREHKGATAGLRTFPLVSMSACAYVIVATAAFGEDPSAQARVLQGLITGIGFVGGGAILKHDDRVAGTATAAGVWSTGAIGAAVGHGRLDIAVALAVAAFATLRGLSRFKQDDDD